MLNFAGQQIFTKPTIQSSKNQTATPPAKNKMILDLKDSKTKSRSRLSQQKIVDSDSESDLTDDNQDIENGMSPMLLLFVVPAGAMAEHPVADASSIVRPCLYINTTSAHQI